MKKGIKINVQTKQLETIYLNDDYRNIYHLIGNGCRIFCIPVEFENGDSLYADDESLLRPNDIKGGFIMEEWSYPIVGNAVIFGCDENGETIDCLTQIEDISSKISFLDIEDCIKWAMKNREPFIWGGGLFK